MSTEAAKNYFKIQNENPSFHDYYGNPKPLTDLSILPQITLESLGLTVASVKEQLLGMGQDLVDPETGKGYPDSFYEHMIEQAVANTEKELDIVIRPRVTLDRQDFNLTEANSLMFLRTYERPIIQVEDLSMGYNNQMLYKFPDEFVKVNNLYGQIEIQPSLLMNMTNGASPQSIPVTAFPFVWANDSYGLSSSPNFVAQMIGIKYVAGMLPPDPAERGINRAWYIHPDLVAYVAKKATIEVLERWGRLILGAGIAGYSLNVDGISTSVNSTQSAENTGSTADIKLLQTDMKSLKDNLMNYYGHNIASLS